MSQKIQQIIENIAEKYPCRDKLIEKLYYLIGCSGNEAVPSSVHLYGLHSTGKTVILKEFILNLGSAGVFIDCLECFSSKILYESILNGLLNHKLRQEDGYAPAFACDNGRDFIDALDRLPSEPTYILCLDNAEKLRDMDANILPLLTRLKEFSGGGLRICCVFVTVLRPENMCAVSGLGSDSCVFYWPQYTDMECFRIMINQHSQYKIFVAKKLISSELSVEEQLNLFDEIENRIDIQLLEQYLKMFINCFFKNNRSISELLRISRECFVKYCEPILNGTIQKNDMKNLFANVNNTFKAALNPSYRTVDLYKDTSKEYYLGMKEDAKSSIASTSPKFELPYYGKFLLIAAYLASHNESKLDKRLFMKHHGKQRKQLKTIKNNAKVSEKLSTQLGPKSFSIDRLLAIFYAIIDEKVSLSCMLLAQISSLVHLKLLTYVAGENSIMEGTARLQCTVSLEFIRRIGGSVGFNVCQYLSDFI